MPRWSNATWARGPGVVKGVFVELPRYFADTGSMQDLESRLSPAWKRCRVSMPPRCGHTPVWPGEQNNMTALATWIVIESQGHGIQPAAEPCAGKDLAYEVGKRLFFQRGGPHDFSCASCHGEDGKRIRLQDLPNLTKNPGDGVGLCGLAGLPCVQRPDVGHAAAPERLLPPATLSRTRNSAVTHRSRWACTSVSTAKGRQVWPPAIKR
jgi:mono/diheme cytochrome c family protein